MVKIAAVQFGFRESAANFRKLGKDTVYGLEDVMNAIVDDMTEIEERVFTSQGRRGGGMWRYVTPAWARRKARLGGDPRTGHFRRKLRRSVTYRGDPNMFLKMDSRAGTIQFGSKLPYAHTQQRHRRFIKFLPGDSKRWARMIAKSLKNEYKGRAVRRLG